MTQPNELPETTVPVEHPEVPVAETPTDTKEDKSSDEVTRKTKPFKTTNPSVTRKYDVIVPRSNGKQSTYPVLPSVTSGELTRRPSLRMNKLLNETENPANENDVYSVSSIFHMMLSDVYSKALGRKEADWQQSVEQDGVSFRPSRPNFKSPDKGSKISSETAIRKLESKFGLGGYITVPLIHSGLWVRLRPATPMEFAFLNEKIQMEKEEFGKRSLGVAFSNHKVFIINHLIDFIEDHVEDMSLEGWVAEDLRRLVKVTDLMILVAATLHSMYPNGFDYVTPCVADDDCGQHSTYRLKIINAIWFDRSRMTKSQKRHMLDRTKHYTEEEILKYQAEVDESRDNKLVLGEDDLEIYFKVPTVEQHISAGYKWFEDIETMIDQTFKSTQNKEQRLIAMNQGLGLTVLRQYGHFFKTIRFLDDDTYIEEGESLDKALERFSNMSDATDKIIEAVGEYIESQSSAIVALPRVPCPHCGGADTNLLKEHPFLIPLDVISLFFTMGGLRTQLGSQN